MSRILVACEESQVVCKAFRELEHKAYSCDIEPCSGGKPEWHIQDDAIKVAYNSDWDLMIAHPPCTYLANSGVSWLNRQEGRWDKMKEGALFFKDLLYAPIKHIVVENPIMHKYAKEIIGCDYDQIIQPWQFGEDASKATCLWLKNLPKLVPTNIIIKDRYANQTPSGQNNLPPSEDRAKLRSKTYEGIGKALADQYGKII